MFSVFVSDVKKGGNGIKSILKIMYVFYINNQSMANRNLQDIKDLIDLLQSTIEEATSQLEDLREAVRVEEINQAAPRFRIGDRVKILTPVIFGGSSGGTRENVIGNIVVITDHYITVRVRRTQLTNSGQAVYQDIRKTKANIELTNEDPEIV